PSLAPYSFHQCHLGLVKMATRPSTRRRKSSSENRAQNATVVLEDNKTGAAAETSSLLKELKAILIPAVSERERLEKRRKHEAGVVNDYAVDFDAARLEIGRRLACLRAAGDPGRLSE
ncbi:hypothetical protein, partial [Pseudoruegeria sp. SK021]|uniref:hypothetical protein n=1 Tax=Pseudoruegeria sp. SK021 TaxID=1933035 RepID=UPI00197E0967